MVSDGHIFVDEKKKVRRAEHLLDYIVVYFERQASHRVVWVTKEQSVFQGWKNGDGWSVKTAALGN